MGKNIWLNKRRTYFRIIHALIFFVSILPIACNYFMDGGMIREWILRVGEMAENGMRLFPTAEVYRSSGINDDIFQSNLWFWGSALIYRWSNNLVLAYRLTMLMIQILTFVFSMLFFQSFFAGKKIAALTATALYITCPYRIYACYDLSNPSLGMAFALLPLYALGVQGVFKKCSFFCKEAILSALALAGIGYAHHLVFFAAAGITILAVIWLRRFAVVPALLCGTLISWPWLDRLSEYLLHGGFEEWEISSQTIMLKGYHLGNYFSTYIYPEGLPGMGLAMLVCLGAIVWNCVVEGRSTDKKINGFFVRSGVLCLAFSYWKFPWEFAQRDGSVFFRWIGSWRTPSIFMGIGFFVLCIPAGLAIEDLHDREQGKETANGSVWQIQIFLLLVCLFTCIYQCNMLTFSRVPLDLMDVLE